MDPRAVVVGMGRATPGRVDRPGGPRPRHARIGDRRAALTTDVGAREHRGADDATAGRSRQRLRRDEPEVHVGNRLAAEGLFGIEAGVALLGPDVPVVTALQRRRLYPRRTTRRYDLCGVAVRTEVGDDQVAGTVALAPGRLQRDDGLVGVEDDLAGRVGGVGRRVLVLRAEWIAVVVGGDLAEHVAEVCGESGQTNLGADLVGGVDGDAVVEDPDPDGPERQGVWLHSHRDRWGLTAVHREVLAIDLVTVGGHRDQI